MCLHHFGDMMRMRMPRVAMRHHVRFAIINLDRNKMHYLYFSRQCFLPNCIARCSLERLSEGDE